MINHRKLFPTSGKNSTLPCPDICDSSCPYGCDPYADGYSLPPPASPPPPPPPGQISHSSSPKQSEYISPSVIIMVTLLAGSFFAILVCLIVVVFRPRWNLFRHRQRQPPEATDEEFLDENHGPTGIDYPIWYINTIGLQPSVIESITIFRYKKGESLIEGTECSVCLNEFQNDDTLRLLPKCSHAFHIPCIDTWLRSHINCPICRAGIVSTAATSIPVASNELNSMILRPDEEIQIENPGHGELLNVSQTGEDGFGENRAETGEIIEVQQVDHDLQDVDTVKLNMIPKVSSDYRVTEDDANDGRITEEGIDSDEKPMRKCVSVDSLWDPNLHLSLSKPEDTSEDLIPGGISSQDVSENPTTVRNSDGCSSIRQLLHKRPVRMKRSFSYSGSSTSRLFSRQYCSFII